MITTVCKISYGSQTVPPIVPAVQGDTGRAISFEIADFTPPAGATATYFILKPSGEAIYNSATITDNSILCELTAQSLAEAGENRMQVRVLQGEDIVTSFEVILMVRTFLGDDAIESGTEMNIFDQAVEQATEQFQENAEQIVEEVIESIPADYTELTEEVEQLNERLFTVEDDAFTGGTELQTAAGTGYTGFKLNETGYRVTDSDYNIILFRVYAGDFIKVVSDDKCQFVSSYVINASGTSTRVGPTYGVGTFYLTVPQGALYIACSTPTNSNAHVYMGESVLDTFKTEQTEENGFLESVISGTIDSYIERVNDVHLSNLKSISSIALNNDFSQIIAGSAYGIVIPVIENIKVRIKKIQTITCVCCFTSDYPAPGTTINHYNAFSGVVNTDIAVTTNANDKYILLYTGSASTSDILETIDVLLTTDDTSTRLGDSVGIDVRSTFANIFNSYTAQISDIPYTEVPQSVSGVSADTTNMVLVTGGGKGIAIPVIAGTSIRVIKPQTPICVACFLSDYPKNGVAIKHLTGFSGVVNTNIVAQSQTDDTYLYIYTGTTEISTEDVTVYYSKAERQTVELLPSLDTHLLNLLKYRPVGRVSKPYIALSCDDGLEPLATYTLPRIQYWNQQYNTDIPLHMALFDNSPVLLDDDYLALVTDMCENHNCSIGIHGPAPFENYTPTYLYSFLKRQAQVITDKTGIAPTSVIYPHSSYNDMIMTMCGSWYPACGASGTDASPYTYSDNNGLAMYVGEKSNCYEIYRLSIRDTRIVGDAGIEAVIDYAYDNNLIICPYFHDEDFTAYDTETNNYNKARLDKFITYGMSKGIEFVNFGDIPYLL